MSSETRIPETKEASSTFKNKAESFLIQENVKNVPIKDDQLDQ